MTTRGGVASPRVTEIDRLLAKIVERERLKQRLSRRQLGERLLDVYGRYSFSDKQLAEYELGRHRLSAARFLQLAALLDIDLNQAADEMAKCVRNRHRVVPDLSRQQVERMLPMMNHDQIKAMHDLALSFANQTRRHAL